MSIDEHKFDGVSYLQTPNISRGRIAPEIIVIHYSASGSTEGTVRELTDPTSRKSAHLVIGRDGQVIQIAPFNARTWHCGESSYNGRRHANGFGIGIELVNWGPLREKNGVFKSWAGTKVPAEQAEEGVHLVTGERRYWQRYTPEQIEKCLEVCTDLVKHYGLRDIVGHEDVSPGRKLDPGPLFPLSDFREFLFPERLELKAADVPPDPQPIKQAPVEVKKNSGGLRSLIGY